MNHSTPGLPVHHQLLEFTHPDSKTVDLVSFIAEGLLMRLGCVGDLHSFNLGSSHLLMSFSSSFNLALGRLLWNEEY